MDDSHVMGIERVFRYAAPPGMCHSPRVIAPGCEEIEVIVGGHGAFTESDGSLYDAGPGSMLWYYPDDIVEVTSDQLNPYITMVFRFHVSQTPAERVPFHTKWQDLSACIAFCQHAFHRYHAENTHDGLFVTYHYARLAWEATGDLHTLPETLLPNAVVLARRYITQHIHEPLTVELIAYAAGVSPSHLHLLFRRHLHASPMQQVIRERIRQARELLVASPLSIKEIGYRVGFQHMTHFCRTFKSWVQMTPSEYRERHVYPDTATVLIDEA